ncbi:uncharacterized protein VP01_3832g2 [Puccinia sorghi]|uniref:Uncharacterized protein n=1 Tax=Puccinia sorghi TaxID=27349 RepID=A0A0L6UTB5_9BASI|nr:uncharacterized protein VP01_3832g2 [Puccinia sorghi]
MRAPMDQMQSARLGSTKNFHEHLLKVHRLVNPKLSKKLDQSQSDISRYLKTSKLQPKVCNGDYAFCRQGRPSILNCGAQMFHNLIRLVNDQATLMATNITRHSLSPHMTKIFIHGQQKMKMEYLSKQQWVSFWQDAWTTPNVTAFLAITAHFVDENFQMTYFTIAVPHIQRCHTGQDSIDDSFVHRQEPLPHCACDLGAKAGLAVLGSVDDLDNCDVPTGKNNESHGMSIMLISNLTSSPDGLSLNLKTIVKQIHGLRTYVCFSPQRRERFKAGVDFAQPNLHELGYNFTVLNIDVLTR